MAQGHVTVDEHPYMEKMISISQYPLSGASAISRVLGAIEHEWGVASTSARFAAALERGPRSRHLQPTRLLLSLAHMANGARTWL